jgi:hypothetical protein
MDQDRLLQEMNLLPKEGQPTSAQTQLDLLSESDSTLDSPTSIDFNHDVSPQIAMSYLDGHPPNPGLSWSLIDPHLSQQQQQQQHFYYHKHSPVSRYSSGDNFPILDGTRYEPDEQHKLNSQENDSVEQIGDQFCNREHYVTLGAWPTYTDTYTDHDLSLPTRPWAKSSNFGVSFDDARSSLYSHDNEYTLACTTGDSVRSSVCSKAENNPFKKSTDSMLAPLAISPNQEVGAGHFKTTWLSLPPKKTKPTSVPNLLFLHKSSAYPNITVQPGTPSSDTFPQTVISQENSRIKSSFGVIEYINPPSTALVRPALGSYPLLSHAAIIRRTRSPSFPVGIGASLSSSNPRLLREAPYTHGIGHHAPVTKFSSMQSARKQVESDEIKKRSCILETSIPQPPPSAVLERHSIHPEYHKPVSSFSRSLYIEYQNHTKTSIAAASSPPQPTTQDKPRNSGKTAPTTSSKGFVQNDDRKYIHGIPLIVVIACMWLGNLLVALLGAMVPIAIPSISTELHGIRDIGLYGSSYFLSLAAFYPTFRKLYQLTDTRLVYLASLLIFQGSRSVSGRELLALTFSSSCKYSVCHKYDLHGFHNLPWFRRNWCRRHSTRTDCNCFSCGTAKIARSLHKIYSQC